MMATKKTKKTEINTSTEDISIMEMHLRARVPKLTTVPLPQYEIDWDKLSKNVKEALEEYERDKLVQEAPYHPGYEGAVIKNYEPDDGPLTDSQIKQIKKSAAKPAVKKENKKAKK